MEKAALLFVLQNGWFLYTTDNNAITSEVIQTEIKRPFVWRREGIP